MTSSTVELPRDVWLLVVDFLETDTLLGLLTVNRFFYHLCLQERYHTVRVGFLGTMMMKTIAKLR